MNSHRIVSLLPAATEIIAALGLEDQLVAISHDCDYPTSVRTRPRATRSLIQTQDRSSVEIDRQVRETLRSVGTLYALDEALLRELSPTVLFSQALCDVCAVGYACVADLAQCLPGKPPVINLEPTCLADIMENIQTVGDVLGVPKRASKVVLSLTQRLQSVREHVQGVKHPTVAVIEWINPLFGTGHWGPELVDLAGGADCIGRIGERSVAASWDDIVRGRPNFLFIACCGLTIERTLRELSVLAQHDGWRDLPAIQSNNVYVLDGTAAFSRPGPRVVDTVEILEAILHGREPPECLQTYILKVDLAKTLGTSSGPGPLVVSGQFDSLES